MGRINATDYGDAWDRLEAPPIAEGGFILLLGINPWNMVDHAGAHLGHNPCPICEGKPLGRKLYCLGCDRTGLDQVAAFPGLAVDEARDPDWDGSEWVEVDLRVA